MRDLDHHRRTEHGGPDHDGPAPGKRTRSERIQRKATPGATPSSTAADDALATAAGSSGTSLPAPVQARFEASTGADLSSVRVHTGDRSAAAAEGLGARAFTTGQDIHFGAGQYQPDDPFGMHLLAHEVAHTVQQGPVAGAPQTKLEVSEPGDALEVEADRAADAMVHGQPTALSAGAPAAARKVHRFADPVGVSASATTAEAHTTAPVTPDNPTGAPAPEVTSADAPAAGGGNAGRAMVRIGSHGGDVEALQQQLTAAGHPCAVDGAFGPATRAAVMAFQRASGLAVDGIVGPMTWGALGGARTPASKPPGTGASTSTPGTTTGGGAGGGATTGGATGSTPATTHTTAPPQVTGDKTGGEAPPPVSDNPVRNAIVAAARSKIGSIYSDVPGAADDTGDKTRTGWESLTEVFSVAYPSFPPQIIKYIKYGKNNGKAGSSSNGLVSWCGIFATWAVITGGGNCGTWDGGPRCSSMSKITSNPKPGDVGYFTANQHHCIIASVNGDQIETIDGNSYDSDGGGNGAVTSRMRSRGDFAGFFRQVDD